MAENYYYSSLSGDEIEQTLVGAVRFNTNQQLTTSQKAAARANIGAGESNTTFKILGYFPTFEDLQEWLQQLPQSGDAYGIGAGSPYDIYVWDGIHNTWVNNGPIAYSDAVIDDEDISLERTWSSTKINTEVEAVRTVAKGAKDSLATYVRPNLLDNWYFVGGGSQLGYGKFPVNQRGQASYSGSGYCIDRFRGDYSTKELSADGLTVTRTGAGTWSFLQGVSTPPVLGKTITFSALITDYSGNARLQISWFEGSTQRQVYNAITSVGVTSVTLSVPSTASNISAIVWIGAENDYVKLSAVKLEVGSTQTLAHQENGVWVLNEVPNYSDELTKCRRYYRRYVSNGLYDFCLNGCLTSSKAHLLVGLPDGTPMVKRNPNATISGSVVVRCINGYIANPSTETLVIANNGIAEGYGTTLPIQKSTLAVWTDDDINNTPIQVNLPAGTIIEISAE